MLAKSMGMDFQWNPLGHVRIMVAMKNQGLSGWDGGSWRTGFEVQFGFVIYKVALRDAFNSTSNILVLILDSHEAFTPAAYLVGMILVNEITVIEAVCRYTDGKESYTFAPVEPLGAQSLTIYRTSGEIVLNRE